VPQGFELVRKMSGLWPDCRASRNTAAISKGIARIHNVAQCLKLPSSRPWLFTDKFLVALKNSAALRTSDLFFIGDNIN
jgi:hypothetical protein